MPAAPKSAVQRVLIWLVDHNPTYLLSACFVAVGARGLLVDPLDPAGDVRLIIITLVALQCYEWTVGAILIALHRARRAPEDAPSLLLVAALFWTGPIAATLEMIALRPRLGSAMAAGACLIAIGEMVLVSRRLGIAMRRGTHAIAAACVILLAVVAPLLKMPLTSSGINEVMLYAAWWVFAALLFACRGVARAYRSMKLAGPGVGIESPTSGELGFLAVTLVATALHLYAMNYGFFCHARAFYAAPAMIAVAAVGMSQLHPCMKRFTLWITFLAALPMFGITLSCMSFDPHVPIELIPPPLRSPIVPTLVIAAAAWHYGFARHRFITLFHVANAALVLAVFRGIEALGAFDEFPASRMRMVVLGSAAAYFAAVAIARRSRGEALAALALGFAAVVQGSWGLGHPSHGVAGLAMGWVLLAGLHLAIARPRLSYRLLAIAILVASPWLCGVASTHRSLLVAHSVSVVLVLVVVGGLYPWTRYRTIGIGLASCYALAGCGRWIAMTPSPTATILTISGFVLLFGGAVVSWNKERLMSSMLNGEKEAR